MGRINMFKYNQRVLKKIHPKHWLGTATYSRCRELLISRYGRERRGNNCGPEYNVPSKKNIILLIFSLRQKKSVLSNNFYNFIVCPFLYFLQLVIAFREGCASQSPQPKQSCWLQDALGRWTTWVWILIDLGDDSEEPSNLWAVNPDQTQVSSCTLTGRLVTAPGYQRYLLTPVGMETPSPSPALPTGSGSIDCCAFHLQGDKSPRASQGQLLASSLVGGFFDIHTAVSISVLADHICKRLLWLTLNFHWAYGPKHFEGWADISSAEVPTKF